MRSFIKNRLDKIPCSIQAIFKLYLLGLGIFTFYRIILLLSNYKKIPSVYSFDFINTFIVGFRFDTTICCYILIIPSILFTINDYIKKKNALSNIAFYVYFILLTFSFVITAIDIPFFNIFFDRISTSILLWGENTNLSISIFFTHWSYLWPLIVFFISTYILYSRLQKIKIEYCFNKDLKKQKHYIYTIPFFILFFFAMRGKINFDVPPLDTRDAYHCNTAIYNKLSINPVYSFMRSYLNTLLPENTKVSFMDRESAIKISKKNLNILNNNYKSPIARDITSNNNIENKYNIVVVMLESMAKKKMGIFGNKLNITPNLDNIAKKGISFDNFYSSGIHTYNGVFSTLYSFPAIYRKKPTNTSPINEYYGMPQVLKENGYQTAFFTTHNETFDNLGSFLRANGFDKIYSDKDYPKDKLIGTWGVADDYLFDFSIIEMDKMSKNNKPFLSVLLTCSDHPPFTLPKYFNPKSNNIETQIVEYVDWSVGKLIKESSKYSWFKNTLFVFIADHGKSIDAIYNMPLSLNQIPFIVYNPNLINNKSIKKIGIQIDVFPTIMGILGINYTNTTMGIDLMKEERPYAFFNGDDKFGVIDDSLFYIYKDDGSEYLYKYRNNDVINYNKKYYEKSKIMKNYASSFLETYQYILDYNLEGKPQKHKN